jgi:hypothetical protein
MITNMKTLRYFFFPLLSGFLVINPSALFSQIVADHTIVDDYDKIPQTYINEVKKMWVILAGESHSKGYRIGCQLLENIDPRFQVSIRESGTPDGYTDQNLRLSRATWGDYNNSSGWIYDYGEEDWFTNATAISRTKAHLTYCNTNNLQISAMGFGWCWDMTSNNWPAGTPDPVYHVRWAGRSEYGPQGSMRWGLDDGDFELTGNTVSMDTYLNATNDYSNYCSANSYPTKIFYTTGPVDANENLGENGYQRHLKHNYIRQFVASSGERILFDYDDILCWNGNGERREVTWTDYGGFQQTFQAIHADNLLDMDGTYTEDGDHIGQRGALRLAKAMWWMLARMAGWDGEPLGLNQPADDYKIRMLPNPVSDFLTVQIDNSNPTGNISVTDLIGRELLSKELVEATTEVDMRGFPDGVYIVKLRQNDNIELRKIVKN